jgi:hypothetical protein
MWKQTIFVALASTLVGCALPPKTVGQGTASDSDSESGSEGATEGGSESAESQTSMASEPSTGDTSDSNVSVASTGSECLDDECPWEPCTDAACGTFCSLCAPWEDDCSEPGTYTVCAASGQCEIWENWEEDACPGEGLQSGFQDTLTQFGGCSDMTVFAANADATIAVHLQIEGLVQEAHTSGAPVHEEMDVFDERLAIEITFGSDLLVATCTDIAGNEPNAIEHWAPASSEGGDDGTIMIDVVPDLDNPPNATATVTFSDVTIGRTDPGIFDPQLVIDELVIQDALVGWLPG